MNRPQHPEQAEDEIYLKNIDSEYEYEIIPYKTKRLGNSAYDELGKSVGGYAVFVKKSEMEESQNE